MELSDHLHKLRYFIRVVESGSIKEGAVRAYLSQPQMTKVIKQLEDVVGSQLFVRSKSGVELTGAGAKFYSFAKETIESSEALVLDLKEPERPTKGKVSIGTYDSIACYFFPYFLKYFSKRNPSFEVHLKTGRSPQVVSLVKKEELDFAVVVAEKKPSGVDAELVYSDFFGLYVAPNMSQHFYENLIYFDFPLNDTQSAMQRFKFKDSISCDNLETVKTITESGLGIGLLPHKVAREGVMAGRLVPFTHPKISTNAFDEHGIYLVEPKKEGTPATQYFKEELLRFLKMWAQR